MKSYFVDTNIFLRFLLDDHPTLSPKAKKLLGNARDDKIALYTTEMVFAELEWVLRSVYKQSVPGIAQKLAAILVLPGLTVTNRGLVASTIKLYSSLTIDFIDAYHIALVQGRKEDALYSFDEDFDKVSGIKRLLI